MADIFLLQEEETYRYTLEGVGEHVNDVLFRVPATGVHLLQLGGGDVGHHPTVDQVGGLDLCGVVVAEHAVVVMLERQKLLFPVHQLGLY